ncbi:MAG: hypothetical protein HY360_05010, partial [Verrucomicrobia bacterium]|nr:hypothetical protein [Verrucomicrobiota bacterium]
MSLKGHAQTTFKDDFDSSFNTNGAAPKGWLCYGTNAEARVQISTEPPSTDEPFSPPNALYIVDRSEKENPLAVRNVSETMQGELALDLYVPPDLSSCVFIYLMGKGYSRAYLTLQGGFPYLSYTTNVLDVVT